MNVKIRWQQRKNKFKKKRKIKFKTDQLNSTEICAICGQPQNGLKT